jgi:hypothetical protein
VGFGPGAWPAGPSARDGGACRRSVSRRPGRGPAPRVLGGPHPLLPGGGRPRGAVRRAGCGDGRDDGRCRASGGAGAGGSRVLSSAGSAGALLPRGRASDLVPGLRAARRVRGPRLLGRASRSAPARSTAGTSPRAPARARMPGSSCNACSSK